mmetsp:Transcript_101067/g.179355  ORF Transcript_101067/g.179355 Transcript_101067/m.179355 type:complete len:419 (-) Transcript_101067:275-1531(-)
MAASLVTASVDAFRLEHVCVALSNVELCRTIEVGTRLHAASIISAAYDCCRRRSLDLPRRALVGLASLLTADILRLPLDCICFLVADKASRTLETRASLLTARIDVIAHLPMRIQDFQIASFRAGEVPARWRCVLFDLAALLCFFAKDQLWVAKRLVVVRAVVELARLVAAFVFGPSNDLFRLGLEAVEGCFAGKSNASLDTASLPQRCCHFIRILDMLMVSGTLREQASLLTAFVVRTAPDIAVLLPQNHPTRFALMLQAGRNTALVVTVPRNIVVSSQRQALVVRADVRGASLRTAICIGRICDRLSIVHQLKARSLWASPRCAGLLAASRITRIHVLSPFIFFELVALVYALVNAAGLLAALFDRIALDSHSTRFQLPAICALVEVASHFATNIPQDVRFEVVSRQSVIGVFVKI